MTSAGAWPGYYVFVGHSQGGLISRFVYQYAAGYTPGGMLGLPLAGVVTIGTPHEGAPIATLAPILQRALLASLNDERARDCTGALNMAGECYVVDRLGAYVEGDLQAMAQAPALSELQPGSGFLSALSRGSEVFHRANISSYADPRWVMFRLAGDSPLVCAPLDPSCNGGGFAAAVEQTYNALRQCSVVAPWMRLLPLLVGAARQCGAAYAALDRLDLAWRQATQGSDATTDGIVPGASQHSNGRRGCVLGSCQPPSQYVMPHGPSHNAEPYDPIVYQTLQGILDREYRVGWHY